MDDLLTELDYEEDREHDMDDKELLGIKNRSTRSRGRDSWRTTIQPARARCRAVVPPQRNWSVPRIEKEDPLYVFGALK